MSYFKLYSVLNTSETPEVVPLAGDQREAILFALTQGITKKDYRLRFQGASVGTSDGSMGAMEALAHWTRRMDVVCRRGVLRFNYKPSRLR